MDVDRSAHYSLSVTAESVAYLSPAAFLWRASQHTVRDHGHHYHSYICAGDKKGRRLCISVYASGGGLIFWVLSFGFYLPVVLFSASLPIIGMLMIPKTLAYVWIVLMGWRLYRQSDTDKPSV